MKVCFHYSNLPVLKPKNVLQEAKDSPNFDIELTAVKLHHPSSISDGINKKLHIFVRSLKPFHTPVKN